jgi:protein-S-isoprenylcysteine O-methyltransferase Ste14
MYSGMALFMIGEWMIWGTRPTAALQYLALYAVCVLLFVLAYEEPVLEKKFGEDYLMFRRNVPRFLPRLTAWDPEKAKGATNSGS